MEPRQAGPSISIHALLAESDRFAISAHCLDGGFLSTLSLRRATVTGSESQKLILHFYPRSPCGERPRSAAPWQAGCTISIHALLAESDWGPRWIKCRHPPFLSTLSLRRATLAGPSGPAFLFNFYPRSPCGERRYWFGVPVVGRSISIHALLAESDIVLASFRAYILNFYPRSPCGERRYTIRSFGRNTLFLSTLSLRRATPRGGSCYLDNIISIHALLAESDGFELARLVACVNFYPRSPCGERRRRSVKLFRQNYISIHALLAESDPLSLASIIVKQISIHALLAESDR